MIGHQDKLQTIKGYITALPKSNHKEDSAHVSVIDEAGVEYLVYPKGIGLDLDDNISVGVELSGVIEEKDETLFVKVRNYKLQDEYDNQWYDDDNE